MATKTGTESPSGMLVGPAIQQFIVTLVAVIAAFIDEEDQELTWLRKVWVDISKSAQNWEIQVDLEEDFPNDWQYLGPQNHLLPLDVLLTEIAYFCLKFRPLTLSIWSDGNAPFTDSREAGIFVQNMASVTQSSNPSKPNLETGEVILDSIDKVLGSLPSWARKILHGLMEALKIVRLQA